VARKDRKRNIYRVLVVGNPGGKDNLKDLRVERRVILK
jgi:hypothetical protein